MEVKAVQSSKADDIFSKTVVALSSGGGDDIISLIGMMSDSASAVIPVIVNDLFGSVAEEQSGYTQTPKIFLEIQLFADQKEIIP